MSYLNQLRTKRLLSAADDLDEVVEKVEILSPLDAAFLHAMAEKFRITAYLKEE